MPVDRATPVAIAVVRDGDRFLVGIRPEGIPLAGFAEFPGGKVLDTETPEAACVRECREESGLDVEIVDELLTTVHQYEHELLEIHFVECRAIGPSAAPREPFRWVEYDELSGMKFPAANAALMPKLAAAVGASAR